MFRKRGKVLTERDLVASLFGGKLDLRRLQFGEQLGAQRTTAATGLAVTVAIAIAVAIPVAIPVAISIAMTVAVRVGVVAEAFDVASELADLIGELRADGVHSVLDGAEVFCGLARAGFTALDSFDEHLDSTRKFLNCLAQLVVDSKYGRWRLLGAVG